MSIDTLVPQVSASDLLSLQEISELLRPTGYPASVTTLRRWISRHDIPTERRGRAYCASFSDILMVHKQEVLAKRDES
ncbi:hypothetical protein [Streptomyces xanthochromogenes]